MEELAVLWVDDDISSNAKALTQKLGSAVKGVKLYVAQSCEASETILKSLKEPPACAIVDLVVPQGKWGTKYYQIPGIEYIKELKARYGDKISIVAFSIMVDQNIENQVKSAGADGAFVKSNISFVSVLDKIRNKRAGGLDD